MTGERLRRLKEYVRDEPFLLTYGDGVADVNIDCLIDFHQQNNRFGFSSNIASVFGNKMIDGVGAEIFSFDLLEKIVKANM